MTTLHQQAIEAAAQFRAHPASQGLDQIEAASELIYTLAEQHQRLFNAVTELLDVRANCDRFETAYFEALDSSEDATSAQAEFEHWCGNVAKAEEAALELLAEISTPAITMHLYRQALRSFDWFHEFSDCAQTRKAGAELLQRLRAMQRQLDPAGTVWRSIAPKGHGVPQPE